MKVRAAQIVRPSVEPPPHQRHPVGKAVGGADGYGDQRPQPFRREAVLFDPKPHADRREHRQRQDRGGKDKRCGLHRHIVAACIVVVAHHGVRQHETPHRAGEQHRRRIVGGVPQRIAARKQQHHDEGEDAETERHGKQRQNQHHNALQGADDRQLVAQDAHRRAEGGAGEQATEAIHLDQILDGVDPDQAEQRVEQPEHQPRKQRKGDGPTGADHVRPDMAMRFHIRCRPAQAMEAGLEQRDGKDREEHARGKREFGHWAPVVPLGGEPRDTPHHRAQTQREEDRLQPTSGSKHKGERGGGEEHESGKCSAERAFTFVFEKQVDDQACDRADAREDPRPQRPVARFACRNILFRPFPHLAFPVPDRAAKVPLRRSQVMSKR